MGRSLGDGVRSMKLYEEMEVTAETLLGAPRGSIANRLGLVLASSLSHSDPDTGTVAKVQGMMQDHAEGAPETSPHCGDLYQVNMALRNKLKETQELLQVGANERSDMQQRLYAVGKAREEDKQEWQKSISDRIKISSELGAANRNLNQLRADYNKDREAWGDTTEERNKLRILLGEANVTLKAHVAQIQQLKLELEGVEERLKSSNNMVEAQSQVITRWSDRYKDLQNTNRVLAGGARDLEDRIASLKQSVKTLTEQVSAKWSKGPKGDVGDRGPSFADRGGTSDIPQYAGAHSGRFSSNAPNTEEQPKEWSPRDEMLSRLGADGAKWASEFAKTFRRVLQRHPRTQNVGHEVISDLENLALGWFCDAIEDAKKWSPRDEKGEVIWQGAPGDDTLRKWERAGYFEHCSDAARMVMEWCEIPAYRYVAIQTIMDQFGKVQAEKAFQASEDNHINGYSMGVKDTAQRLRNVLNREGLLPAEPHPEQAQ